MTEEEIYREIRATVMASETAARQLAKALQNFTEAMQQAMLSLAKAIKPMEESMSKVAKQLDDLRSREEKTGREAFKSVCKCPPNDVTPCRPQIQKIAARHYKRGAYFNGRIADSRSADERFNSSSTRHKRKRGESKR